MSPAELILTFAVGGLSLKALVAWLKKLTRLKGFSVLLLTLITCAAVSAIYILVASMLGLPLVGWNEFLYLACEVFVGTQVWYRATKKEE